MRRPRELVQKLKLEPHSFGKVWVSWEQFGPVRSREGGSCPADCLQGCLPREWDHKLDERLFTNFRSWMSLRVWGIRRSTWGLGSRLGFSECSVQGLMHSTLPTSSWWLYLSYKSNGHTFLGDVTMLFIVFTGTRWRVTEALLVTLLGQHTSSEMVPGKLEGESTCSCHGMWWQDLGLGNGFYHELFRISGWLSAYVTIKIKELD